MPLWYIKAHRSFRADAAIALAQINAHLRREAASTQRLRAHVVGTMRRFHDERAQRLALLEKPDGDAITPEFLTASGAQGDRRGHGRSSTRASPTIPPSAIISRRTKPLTYFASGGGSLGWNGGAAIGMKLAAPDKTFVALTGDGSYMFSIPSTVHWMARHYRRAVSAGRLQQSRLEGAEIFRPRGSSRRLRQPRQRHRRQLRPAARLCRHGRRGGRRFRADGEVGRRSRERHRRRAARCARGTSDRRCWTSGCRNYSSAHRTFTAATICKSGNSELSASRSPLTASARRSAPRRAPRRHSGVLHIAMYLWTSK